MLTRKVKIQNPSGLQLDGAGAFCQAAMSFNSKVHFMYRGENEANAKSVLSILGAGIRSGETIELVCDGDDEAEAVEAIANLLEGRGNS